MVFTLRDGRLYVRTDAALLWALAALVLAFLLRCQFPFSLRSGAKRRAMFDLHSANSFLSGILLTPVLYPLSQVPEAHRGWMFLNPLAIIVETFKWGLFGVGQFYPDAFAVTSLIVAAIFVSGLTHFRDPKLKPARSVDTPITPPDDSGLRASVVAPAARLLQATSRMIGNGRRNTDRFRAARRQACTRVGALGRIACTVEHEIVPTRLGRTLAGDTTDGH